MKLAQKLGKELKKLFSSYWKKVIRFMVLAIFKIIINKIKKNKLYRNLLYLITKNLIKKNAADLKKFDFVFHCLFYISLYYKQEKNYSFDYAFIFFKILIIIIVFIFFFKLKNYYFLC